jgi:hypothetical protein
MSDNSANLPPSLSQAGSTVDQAIKFLTDKNIDEISIASALLGGAMQLLARSLPEETIIGILNNAIASVRAGELRDPH